MSFVIVCIAEVLPDEQNQQRLQCNESKFLMANRQERFRVSCARRDVSGSVLHQQQRNLVGAENIFCNSRIHFRRDSGAWWSDCRPPISPFTIMYKLAPIYRLIFRSKITVRERLLNRAAHQVRSAAASAATTDSRSSGRRMGRS